MAVGEEIGKKSLQDLHQYVMAWMDQGSRILEELLHTHRMKITLEIEKK